MISVYKSETGQFVLVHPPTQTVLIEADLAQAYEKMLARIREKHPEHEAALSRPFEPPAAGSPAASGGWRAGLFLALAVLPFVWIGALQYSLAALANDAAVRAARVLKEDREAAVDPAEIAKLRTEAAAAAKAVASIKAKNSPETAADFASIKQELEALKAQMQTANADAAAKAAQTAPLADGLRALRTDLDSVKAGLGPVQQDVLSTKSSLPALQAELSRLEGLIAGLAGKIPAAPAPPQQP